MQLQKRYIFKMCLFSLFGIFIFFIPVQINSKTTIPLDHIISFIKTNFRSFPLFYAGLMILTGGLYPFLIKTWKTSTTTVIFSFLKLAGIFITILFFLSKWPSCLFEKDMLPFLFYKLVIPVGIIVPVGAVFLAFLIDYGLLEFVGVLMEPVMKPIFKTPGRSAVDAVASFVGSYSIGLLITNRVFKKGEYSVKQAAIIATGFSTVSVTFMIIVAKTTGLMQIWNFYFWSTLFITFTVTAITARLFPISGLNDNVKNDLIIKNKLGFKERFMYAVDSGTKKAMKADPLLVNIKNNFYDGLKMTISILPTIMSVGLLGLVLAKHTPLFDIAGYIFYPVPRIIGIPESVLIGKSAAVGITEMFLPALLIKDAAIAARYTIAVTSVSSILFFSASIPCILSTEIPISTGKIVLIWAQRTFLSLLIAGLTAVIIF